MILFFVTEKSVIPVNGALESKEYSLLKSGGWGPHWDPALCRQAELLNKLA